MRIVCLISLSQVAAGLLIQNTQEDKEDVHPKYALAGEKKDIEVVWQRPHGPPVGVFMYLHGCGNRALDMWAQKGHDGWEFKECTTATKKGFCAGLPQEALMKSTARQRGYLVMAVQGGATSNRGCFHEEDVPRIKAAIKHVYIVEKLGEMPLIMAGMSAGGRVIGDLVASNGGAGVPMKCAAIMVAEIQQKRVKGWPTGLPIGFWHMPKDAVTEELITKNVKGLQKHKCKVEDKEIVAAPITEEFLVAGGHGFNTTTAGKAIAAFKVAGLLNDKNNLKFDPYNPKPKTRWMKAIEASEGDLRGEIGGFGQQATMTKLMERSWASHALPGDKTNDVIDFCEKDPSLIKTGKR